MFNEKIKTYFFDFDGTLHDIFSVYNDIIQEIIIRDNICEDLLEEKDVKNFLGETPESIWKFLMPDLLKEDIDKYIEEVGNKLNNSIIEGESNLYDGAEVLLKKLRDGNRKIIIISNCTEKYKNVAIERFDLNKYIDEFYSAEDFDFQPKEIILEKIIHKYKGEYIFIGDRYHDILAANYNKIDSIFCKYGYGKEIEGKDATYIIDNIKETLQM